MWVSVYVGVGWGVGGITISYWSISLETVYKANITMWVSVVGGHIIISKQVTELYHWRQLVKQALPQGRLGHNNNKVIVEVYYWRQSVKQALTCA